MLPLDLVCVGATCPAWLEPTWQGPTPAEFHGAAPLMTPPFRISFRIMTVVVFF